MTTPELSVVVPTHDVAPWVEETIASILAQEGVDMEVIVVDDHSTDDTVELVRSIGGDDPRLTVVRAEQAGGGSARNTGIERARGRWIIFADGDDIVPSGAYRALVGSLRASGSQIAFGDFLKFSPVDTWRPTANMAAYGQTARGVRLQDAPTLLYSRPCWNKAFDREFLLRNDIRFPDVPRSNDILPMTRAYVAATSVDVVPDIVYLYRERPGRSSMTARADSATAVVSYLTQELACGRVLESASTGVRSVYARLIWDRDCFVHVARFLEATAETGFDRDSDAVRELLAQLLAIAGPCPAGVDVFKQLAMRFAARGDIRGARAAVALHFGRTGDTPRMVLWADLLRAYAELPGAPRLGPYIRHRFLRNAQAVEALALPAADWEELRRTASHAFGEGILDLVPQLHFTGLLSSRDDTSLADAAEALGYVDTLSGGTALTVEVRMEEAAGMASSVVLRPVEVTGPVVEPTSMERHKEPRGVRLVARFARHSLPTEQRLQVLLNEGQPGAERALASRAELPVYSPFDPFIFSYEGGALVIYRRRSAAFRALRRAAVIARAYPARRLSRSA